MTFLFSFVKHQLLARMEFFDPSLLQKNITNPAILFFFLGLLGVALRSDLSIPQSVSRFISYYLLFCIGLKGGAEIAHSSLSTEFFQVMCVAIGMALLVPFYTFFLLRNRFTLADSAAIAATFGSISAVTFITAINFLQEMNQDYGGYLVAAMALMEAPAIIVGLWLYGRFEQNGKAGGNSLEILKESFTNASVFLILGALVVGMLADASAMEQMKPFTHDLFKGMLAFFLLDMGLLAGKRLEALRKAGFFLIAFSILVPLLNAIVTIFLTFSLGISVGNSLLLTILCASASYIAVPAAMRVTLPKANAGLYVPMALAITFPFNIIVGLPVYYAIITALHT